MLYRVHLTWAGFELTTSVVIGTDCKGSCKSNNHMITTTTGPKVINICYCWLVLRDWIPHCNIASKAKPEILEWMRSPYWVKHINDSMFLTRHGRWCQYSVFLTRHGRWCQYSMFLTRHGRWCQYSMFLTRHGRWCQYSVFLTRHSRWCQYSVFLTRHGRWCQYSVTYM